MTYARLIGVAGLLLSAALAGCTAPKQQEKANAYRATIVLPADPEQKGMKLRDAIEISNKTSLEKLEAFFPKYRADPEGSIGGGGPHSPESDVYITVMSRKGRKTYHIVTTSGGTQWSTGTGWLGITGDFNAFVSKAVSQKQELRNAFSLLKAENQRLQIALSQLRNECRQQEKILKNTQRDQEKPIKTKKLETINRPQPDFSRIRDVLYNIFHDRKPALWDCDETASRLTRVKNFSSMSVHELIQEISRRFDEQNPSLDSPILKLKKIEQDMAVVTLEHPEIVTEQIGSSGALCFFASVTFSLTSFDHIDRVYFEIAEGSHGAPGIYDRKNFIDLLPLELEYPRPK